MKIQEYSIKIGSYTIPITHPDKIYFPDAKITKLEFVNYYKDMASLILPYTKNRPLTMQRFPEGIKHEGFFQKDASDYFPKWINLKSISKKDGGHTDYVVCNKKAALVYLASQACITPHLWLSKTNKLEYPDQIIFDLDPSSNNFELAREVAFILKDLLTNYGLSPFVMTTGSKGIHVRCPIIPNNKNEEVKDFAYKIASIIQERYPQKATLALKKDKRGKKLFIDILRNSYSATAVAPYAVRPKPGAPIATPISWNELENSALNSQTFKIRNIMERIEKIEDPWKAFFKNKFNLKNIIKNL